MTPYSLADRYDHGTGPVPRTYLTPREARRRELDRRTKAQLVREVNRTLLGSMHPASAWRKDELISFLLDRSTSDA